MNKFLEELGIITNNIEIYESAFTHQSYANENKSLNLTNYERLEFMGDAVVQVTTTEYLIRSFPNQPEGELTKLRQLVVRQETLARFATQLKLYDYIKLGRGEKDNKRESLLADVFEAFIGALFLDGQSEAIMAILGETIFKALDENEFSDNIKNYKAMFQEKIHSENRGDIKYGLLEESGPEHEKMFKVALYLNGLKLGEGKGSTKKEAENFAAKDALSKLSV